MLNITAQKSSKGAKDYFARSDYYTKDSQELVGRWGGKSAALLGLSGEVDKQSFERLCDNLHPETGESLTRITRDDRRVGYDFTWSAPKSASVVHALTGDERIVEAFRKSISETMTEMEAEMQTRVRKTGEDKDRTTGNFSYAEFLHLTSRPVNGMPCPQLHAHLFAFNATYDIAEAQWKAGQFGAIKNSAYYWQAVQQVRFANRLQELGYSVHKTKDAFEIDGVSDTVIKKFSLRTNLIERLAEKLGITDPKVKAKLGATTREAKLDEIPYSELVARWEKILTPDERGAVRNTLGKPKTIAFENPFHTKFAADHLFERASVLDERRLLTYALRHGIGEVTPEGIRSQIGKLGLLKREDKGKTLVTTKEIRNEERRIIGFATQSKGSCRPLVGKQAILFRDHELDSQQQAAVELPLRSTDKIMIFHGVAGTGKSRSVAEIVRQLQERNKEVVLVAPTVRAVDVLRGDGFDDAGTLQGLLSNPSTQARSRNGFIILDEAGLVGSQEMNQLFDVAKDANARIVLLGDKWQLSSVSRGSPLRLLEEKAGLKVVEISNIRRQSGEYREAVKLLSRGKAGEGLEKLDAMGCIKLMPVWDSYDSIARDFANKIEKAIEEKRDAEKECIIVCPTHAEGEQVTDAVRKELRKRELIGENDRTFARLVPLQWTEAERADKSSYSGDEIIQFHRNNGPYRSGQRLPVSAITDKLNSINPANFSVYKATAIALAPGDLIRTTAKGKTLDGKHTVGNGSIYTIKGFDHGNIVLNNNWVISNEFGHIAAAYVNTAFAAQGRTCNHVLIVQAEQSRPASNRQSFYVAASRGRKSVTIYTDDKQHLREAVQRHNPRMAAIELPQRRLRPALRMLRDRLMKVQLAALVAAKSVLRWPTNEQEHHRAR